MLLKCLHIILAFLVLLSSTGVTLHLHYCQDKLKGISLLGEVQSCCAKAKKHCEKPTPNPPGFNKKKCCQDAVDYVKAESDWQPVSFTFESFDSPNIIPFLTQLPSINLVAWILPQSKELMRFSSFKPPPPNRKIYIEIQQFLC